MVQRGFLLLILAIALRLGELVPMPSDSSKNSNSMRGPYRVYRIYPNSSSELDSATDVWKNAAKYHVCALFCNPTESLHLTMSGHED